jgi:hypothetical protein
MQPLTHDSIMDDNLAIFFFPHAFLYIKKFEILVS